MPGAVVEAMALEVPIVASDIAPVREALGDPSLAELVATEDISGLAIALTKAIKETATGRQRTMQARDRFVAHHDVASVAKRMMVFYHNAMEGPARPIWR
jgi:glycosyltransferase involved in cell wall biosynthesis